jgi:hypothetical protein
MVGVEVLGDIEEDKHKIVSVLTTAAGYRPNIIYVLTTVTMTLFLLALFYDLQSPVDDGYCGTLMDETSCLVKRTVLDPNVHKCIWNKPVINDADTMVWNLPW